MDDVYIITHADSTVLSKEIVRVSDLFGYRFVGPVSTATCMKTGKIMYTATLVRGKE
ncbi:hypothetical protein KASHIRA_02770 [Serratia phage vB_SmaM-Kashira]|nr:hypothetical protein [Acinetobacter phage ABPH49]URC22851.1 hypothetical protein KASHIRA_02770 [Serratia phage vB_SmaM-Kashira]